MSGTASTTRGSAPQAGLARGVLRTARPRQWVKNLLVLAAPAAAGVLGDPEVALRVAAAFLLFCLAASGGYFVNDVIDASSDRQHPSKRSRPVAAGQLAAPAAAGIGGLLVAGALAGGVFLGPPAFVAAVAAYLALTVSYSVWLKRYVILDVVALAGCFVVRAVAGALVVGLPITGWFLIVVSFGALFVAVGKRHAETAVLGQHRADHRAVLTHYTPALTQHLLSLSSAVTILGYCLWAFEVAPGPGELWLTFSVVPFVIVMLRYGLLVHTGGGGEPEDVFLRDRPLQVVAVAWVALLVPGLYGS